MLFIFLHLLYCPSRYQIQQNSLKKMVYLQIKLDNETGLKGKRIEVRFLTRIVGENNQGFIWKWKISKCIL